jgi:hypothetical protein
MEVSGDHLHAPTVLSPYKQPAVPVEWEARWTPAPTFISTEELNLLSVPGIEPRFLGCAAYSLVTIPTELSRLIIEYILLCVYVLKYCH